jgi:hypothetical protein
MWSKNCEKQLLASSCLSAHQHGITQLSADGFSWNLIFGYLKKKSRKWKISLVSDKSNGYFTLRYKYIYEKSHTHFFLEWEMFQAKVVQKIKTNILYSIPLSKNHPIYDRMWENTVWTEWPRMIIQCVRFACWISKATDAYSEYIPW